MAIQIINTAPLAGQRPGTSGLRKKTPVFMQPNFLENFVQSTFDAIGGVEADLLAPGHGELWRGNPAEDVALARG